MKRYVPPAIAEASAAIHETLSAVAAAQEQYIALQDQNIFQALINVIGIPTVWVKDSAPVLIANLAANGIKIKRVRASEKRGHFDIKQHGELKAQVFYKDLFADGPEDYEMSVELVVV